MNDTMKLENQLCFRLYSLNKAMTRLYAPVLKELGLTYPQYLVLLVLWQQAGTISVNELGARLDLDSGTLSPLLKRMEKSGLLNRVRASADERKVDVALSDAGRTLKSRAKSIPSQMFQRTGLTLEQLQQLSSELDLLLANISN